MPEEILEGSLMYPIASVDLEVGRQNIMSLLYLQSKVKIQRQMKMYMPMDLQIQPAN